MHAVHAAARSFQHERRSDRASVGDFDLDGEDDNWTLPNSSIELPPTHQGLYGCASRPNDFDNDGTIDSPHNQAPFEQPEAYWATARDWLETMHLDHADPDVCKTPIEGFSTSYDYTRFFWDVTTRSNVRPVHIAAIINAADPHNWNAVATPIDDSNGKKEEDDVIRRLETAFKDEGFEQAFLDERSNGQDHY